MTVAVPPTAIVPMAQVTVVVPLQLPALVLELTNVVLPGIGSESETPVAIDGPLFCTSIV